MNNNPVVINARIKQADLTKPEWIAKNPVLLENEFFFIKNNLGAIVGVICGDGVKRLNEIPVNYFGTGTGEGWEPTLDPYPMDGSINYVNSGALYSWGEDNFVKQVSGKDLSDNNFTNALKTKLESLSPTPASSFEALTGDPMDNEALAAIINDIYDQIALKITGTQALTTVMQYSYPLATSGTVIYYDRYRVYGTVDAPLTTGITDSISNELYPPKVRASGRVYIDVGATEPTLPSRWENVAGDIILNSVNVFTYEYVSSLKVEYSVHTNL